MNKKLLPGALLSLLLASSLLLAFCSITPAHAAVSWNVQIVDVNGLGIGNGYFPIVLDSNSIPHIAYTDAHIYDNDGSTIIGGSVMYAVWNGSSWSTQEIAFGDVTDMVLDADSNPHILYTGIEDRLMYASWTGSNWDIQTVGATKYLVYASLALDSAGNPHAAYSDGTAVKYASRNGSTWTIQTVDTYSEIPFQLSLALDSNDTPYILYAYRTYLESVKLAVWTGSGWDIQTAASEVYGLGNMVLDSRGYPRFVYKVGGVNVTSIMYASWNGAAWETQTVVSGVTEDTLSFLALDAYDHPYISYVHAQSLMYAGWTGAAWSTQSVPIDLSLRGPCYLAVDSSRIPHISFRANPPGTDYFSRIKYMMYATATEPAPLSTPTSAPPSSTPFPTSLLMIATAVIIGASITIVYLWRKKRKPQAKERLLTF
jgi:hypothetical protein